MTIPENLLFSKDHEWVEKTPDGFRVGITDYAQDALGDVVFVKLPELNANVTAGESICEVESTKSVSEVYAPVGGRIIRINTDLQSSPEQINSAPYDAGWICVIESQDSAETTLMDAHAYGEMIAE